MTTFSSQVILSIFFLYVVIISEKLFTLISCNFQTIIKNNRYFKQIFIFINIFLFTFILGWYTENAIYSAKESYNKYENFENNNNNNNLSFFNLYKTEFNIIGKYIIYSLLIYIIFIFTTKCDLLYLKIFFGLLIILFFLFILRTYSKNEYYNNEEFKLIDYINDNERKSRLEQLKLNLDKTDLSNNVKNNLILKFKINMNLQNIEFYLFILSLIVLVIGFVLYYLKQKKDHSKDWNFTTFIIGKNKCDSKK